MSKLSKKVSDKLDQVADAVLWAGYNRGPKAEAVTNTVSRVLLGRYWENCDAGKDCPDPRHEHER